MTWSQNLGFMTIVVWKTHKLAYKYAMTVVTLGDGLTFIVLEWTTSLAQLTSVNVVDGCHPDRQPVMTSYFPFFRPSVSDERQRNWQTPTDTIIE